MENCINYHCTTSTSLRVLLSCTHRRYIVAIWSAQDSPRARPLPCHTYYVRGTPRQPTNEPINQRTHASPARESRRRRRRGRARVAGWNGEAGGVHGLNTYTTPARSRRLAGIRGGWLAGGQWTMCPDHAGICTWPLTLHVSSSRFCSTKSLLLSLVNLKLRCSI